MVADDTSDDGRAAAADPGTEEPVATVRFLPLPAGTYRVSVTDCPPIAGDPDRLTGPVIQLAPAPLPSPGFIEIFPGPGTLDRWLRRREDSMTLRISGGSASIAIISLRPPGSAPMAIDIQLTDSTEPADSANAATGARRDGPETWLDEDALAPLVPLELLAHIERQGDVVSANGAAGDDGANAWIEGFSIRSAAAPPAGVIEYCGVRADGVLTPWLDEGAYCGSRGLAVPLLGYALRVKAAHTDGYDCSYSARFASGRSCEALHDGSLCQSEKAADPIVAIEVRLFRVGKIPAAGTGVTGPQDSV